MVVKPGFVDTPMTQHLSLPKALLSKPEQIASLINDGINKKNGNLHPEILGIHYVDYQKYTECYI